MNSEEEKNTFVPLMDMITSNDINISKQERLTSNNTSYQNNGETIDEEDDSKEKLNPNYKTNLLEMNDSGIIQIPNKFLEEQNQSYSSDTQFDHNTLDESISKTIMRDLKLIYYKLKYVLNPFSSPLDKRFHLNNWDLWGPLLFITFLSCILSMSSKQKSNVMVTVFAIFWIGSFLIYLNANLLDSKIKLFPIICLLGYCLFPLSLAAFILALTNFYDIFKFIIVGIMCFWSLFCVEEYIKSVCEKEQKFLLFYPAALMFIFISWFIFVN